MKRYSVSVPFAGYIVIEVEAPDEDSAIEAAMGHDDCDICKAFDEGYVGEVNFYRTILQGNVCYPSVMKAEAVFLEDVNEEEG